MYRWPLTLNDGPTGELTLEVPPRGAAFTLAALMHLGHPIHLALIDAYLRGEVPFASGSTLGRDSRAVLANLIGPLVALRELGHDQATLADLTLLPADRQAAGHARFLLRAADGRAVRVACGSRLGRESAGLLGNTREPPSHQVITVLPAPPARPNGLARRLAHAPLRVLTAASWMGSKDDDSPARPSDGPEATTRSSDSAGGNRQPTRSTEDATWATLETLLGRPIDERRTEEIVLRLVGPDRATELRVGWSLVLPRNRQVFAAWLGSDGRQMIRLSPRDS